MAEVDSFTLAELESFVLTRAAQDAHFRRALLLDPREAISAELGIELPAGAGIEAVEVSPGQIALTLPSDLAAATSLRASPAAQLRDDCCCCC